MAFEYLRESTLTNSEVWQGLNSIGSVSAKDRAIDLIKNCKHLNPDDIEMSYITLKQMSDPLTRAGVRSFENSRVVLVYNPNHNTSMSQGIPFLTFQQKGIYNTYIFADRFVTVTRDNIMKMESSILRDFLINSPTDNVGIFVVLSIKIHPFFFKFIIYLLFCNYIITTMSIFVNSKNN